MSQTNLAESEAPQVKRQLTVYLPYELTEALRELAHAERSSMTEIIDRAVRAELHRIERKKAIKTASSTEHTPEQVRGE